MDAINELCADRIDDFLASRPGGSMGEYTAEASAVGAVVYFVQQGDCGPIKIGISTRSSLKRRIGALQNGSAWPLHLRRVITADRRLEAKLHAIFAPARMSGEWFWPVHALCVLADAVEPPREALPG